jgi:hypothetical protein
VTIPTFTEVVASQKSKLPFYLYAYCLRIEELLGVAQRMSGLESRRAMQQQQAERNGSSEGGSDRAVEARRHTGPGTGETLATSPAGVVKFKREEMGACVIAWIGQACRITRGSRLNGAMSADTP